MKTGENLTKQEKIFVKEVVETGNLTQSVMEAYDEDDPKYASVKGQRLIAKDRIKNAIQTLADRIPDDKLHEVLMEGLNALRGEEVDYLIRHKYLDTALKLKGLYEADEHKNINILMPVLVKFLDKKDDESNSNGNTDRVS